MFNVYKSVTKTILYIANQTDQDGGIGVIGSRLYKDYYILGNCYFLSIADKLLKRCMMLFIQITFPP